MNIVICTNKNATIKTTRSHKSLCCWTRHAALHFASLSRSCTSRTPVASLLPLPHVLENFLWEKGKVIWWPWNLKIQIHTHTHRKSLYKTFFFLSYLQSHPFWFEEMNPQQKIWITNSPWYLKQVNNTNRMRDGVRWKEFFFLIFFWRKRRKELMRNENARFQFVFIFIF